MALNSEVPGTSYTNAQYQDLSIQDRYKAALTAYQTVKNHTSFAIRMVYGKKWAEQVRLLQPMANALTSLDERVDAAKIAASLGLDKEKSTRTRSVRQARIATANRDGYLSTIFSGADGVNMPDSYKKKTLLGQ